MTKYQEIYIYSDVPTTCHLCGSGTEIILNLSHKINRTQVHKCLSCQYEFVMQTDDEFDDYDRLIFENEDEEIEITIFE